MSGRRASFAMFHTTTLCRSALLVGVWLGGAATVVTTPAAAQRCTASGSTEAAAVPTETTLQQAATSVVREINRERGERQLTRVGVDPRLTLAAQRHSRDMVRRGYFSHMTPDGRGMTARVRATGYLRSTAAWWLGEVLAWGSGDCSTPAAAVAAWLDSPSHRRVMLARRYLEVGVGVELGVPFGAAPGATYAVELGLVRP